MQDFAGRRVLVTGAGKGIGRDVVRRLVARGAAVVALSRSADDLASLREETGCDTVAAELDDPDAAVAALAPWPELDMLVNNAGIALLDPALDAPRERFERTMRVNAYAPLRLAQHVARGLIARGRPGSIVNVSSVAARQGLADHAAYCASKAALDALTRVLAVELGPRGIRVNSVNPTVTLTPMAERAWGDPAKSGPMLARIPLGRFAGVGEIADAVLFLLGDGAAMVNGTCLYVDGGFSAG